MLSHLKTQFFHSQFLNKHICGIIVRLILRQTDRQIKGQLDEWMDGQIDRWMDGWKDGWMDGWMDGLLIIKMKV